jgi:uncharacterized protein YcbX
MESITTWINNLFAHFASFDVFDVLGAISGTMLAGVLTVVVILVYKAQREEYTKTPKPVFDESEIISLRIYPIKSCRGIELKRSNLLKTGLDLDRNWMFVDRTDDVDSKGKPYNGVFQTIRQNASMTLIDTEIDYATDALHIWVHGSDKVVKIPAHPDQEWLEKNTKPCEVEIWEAQTDAWEYSQEINDVFSRHFEKPVALVYKGPTPRPCGTNGTEELYGEKISHKLADVMALQVASESSINDLNRHLEERGQDPITIERFRPNIIVRGRAPWDEDSWKKVQIVTLFHEVEQLKRINLDVVARCARCRVPNVNPDTAEEHPKEPWDTLMKFRRVDTGGAAKWKPCFGLLCVPKGEGEIRVGSKLRTLERTDKHLYNTAKFSDL